MAQTPPPQPQYSQGIQAASDAVQAAQEWQQKQAEEQLAEQKRQAELAAEMRRRAEETNQRR
jgi:hypothetical protein